MARLTRDDWIAAAYTRFSESGIDAVAVEPVARSLGATKGSFYWHFADRAALVDAVLERWEWLETGGIVADLEAEAGGDPRTRLEQLVWIITHRTPQRGGEATLYTAAERNGVAETVARVTERRVTYVVEMLVALGIESAEARRRAIALVASVVGFQQLVAPGWEPSQEPPERIAASLIEMMLGGASYPKRPET